MCEPGMAFWAWAQPGVPGSGEWRSYEVWVQTLTSVPVSVASGRFLELFELCLILQEDTGRENEI